MFEWLRWIGPSLVPALLLLAVVYFSDRNREPLWLVAEWLDGEEKPTKFLLTTLARRMSRKQIVRICKERWRTERMYEDLKGELGLDHFEGRSFPGWHHHVSVVLCCYAFVVAERTRAFPPKNLGDGNLRLATTIAHNTFEFGGTQYDYAGATGARTGDFDGDGTRDLAIAYGELHQVEIRFATGPGGPANVELLRRSASEPPAVVGSGELGVHLLPFRLDE